MPYIKQKREDMKKVFLDPKKIKGKNKIEKAKKIGITKHLFYQYENNGASIKVFKKRGIIDYIKEKK